MSPKSSFRSVGTLTAVNALIALVGVATSVAMALLFGTSVAVQVFFVASNLATVVQKFFQVGQISDLFLPEYIRQRELYGTEKADRCFSVLLNHALATSAVFGIGLIFAAQQLSGWIAPGFSAAEQHEVAKMFQVLVPVLAFMVTSGHFQAIANARGWYGRFEVYSLTGAIGGLIAMICCAHWLGVWALALSQLITQGYSCIGRWSFLKRNGYRHKWIWHEPGFSFRQTLKGLNATTVYVLVTQWYSFAFTAALTLVSGEALAVYKYAENLYVRTSSLFMRPVSVVFFTDAAVLMHRDSAQLRRRLQDALYHYAFIFVGIISAVFPAMPNLLGGLWGSVRYTPAQINETVFYAWFLFGSLLVEGSALVYRKLNITCGEIFLQYLGLAGVQAISALVAHPIIAASGRAGAAVMLSLNIFAFWLWGFALLWWKRSDLLAFFPARSWKLVGILVGPVFFCWIAPRLWPWLQYHGVEGKLGRFVTLGKAGLTGGAGLLSALLVAYLLGVREIVEGPSRLLAFLSARKRKTAA